jgi:hypothetical protein
MSKPERISALISEIFTEKKSISTPTYSRITQMYSLLLTGKSLTSLTGYTVLRLSLMSFSELLVYLLQPQSHKPMSLRMSKVAVKITWTDDEDHSEHEVIINDDAKALEWRQWLQNDSSISHVESESAPPRT